MAYKLSSQYKYVMYLQQCDLSFSWERRAEHMCLAPTGNAYRPSLQPRASVFHKHVRV